MVAIRISRRDGDVVDRFDGQCLDGACTRHCGLPDALGRLLLVEAIFLANRVEGGSLRWTAWMVLRSWFTARAFGFRTLFDDLHAFIKVSNALA